MAIEGVAYATIISQFISAILVLIVLTRSTENYRLTWKDLRIDKKSSGRSSWSDYRQDFSSH